jgi:hypothetical protein
MIIAFGISLTSCDKCAKKVGDPTEKNFQLNKFHSIRITGDFAINLVQDSSFSLRISGGDGILENVKHEIVSDTLRITNENKCNFLSNYSKNITLEIGCGELKKLALTNPGSMQNSGKLRSNELTFEIRECGIKLSIDGTFKKLNILAYTGTPTINLKGSSDNLFIDENSFGHVYAFGMNAINTSISSSGTGFIHVSATNSLKVQHSGSGIVRYRGTPIKVETEIAENSTAQVLAD